MQTSNKNRTRPQLMIAVMMLLMVAGAAQLGADPTRDHPSKMNLATIVPYHPLAGSDNDLSGEACLSMIFDYWGPYIPQQDIRNVTKGRLGSGAATSQELVRASHFSSQSFYTLNQRGYVERALGYGGFSYDWTDNERAPSPRFESRFTDIYNSIARRHLIMVYMYLDMPPEITPPDTPTPPDPNNPQPPDPPDPQITPEDLAALETVWRLVVGYDTNTKQLILHDPIPAGAGFKGGKEVRVGKDNFDRLWNVTELNDGSFSNHRYGVSAAPWMIDDIDYEDRVEAGTTFEISANISYNTPTGMNGAPVEDALALLTTPNDFSIEDRVTTLDIDGTGTFSVVTWAVKAPDRAYTGQDTRFWINATGTLTVSDPAHRDSIGGSIGFDIEARGFLNHPPIIGSAMIDPPYIPDDASIQPVISCIPFDEDGNLREVTVDLSPAGLNEKQKLYDNGEFGDPVEDDGIYSVLIDDKIPVGEWTFMITALDRKGGSGTANISVRVDPISEFTEAPDIVDAGITPKGVPNDGFTPGTIWAVIEDEENDVDRVIADLSQIGGDNKQKLYDDGNNGDIFSNDDNYSFSFAVDPITTLGKFQIEITASDATGHESIDRVWLHVILPPVAPEITAVSPNPEEVPNDGETEVTLTAIVEDGNDDVIEVWVDLTPLKGMSTTMMRDDGVSPDKRDGDDMWTVQFTVPGSVSSGLKGKVDVYARDSINMEGSSFFSIEILQANSDPSIIEFKVSDQTVKPGDRIIVTANVTDQDNDEVDVEMVLTELNTNNVPMLDDGTEPDDTGNDMTFSAYLTIPETSGAGNYNITILVTDGKGGEYESLFVLTISDKETTSPETELETYIYIGVPVGLLILLLVLFGILMVRRSSRSGSAPPNRPPPRIPPFAGRAPPMMRPTR
ncbi:MAG: hypothetical protein U9R75_10930 [Candidatus Thermoplasmatota archaeon]|nr:hypothetical protein [Candidatus Thermoplasmatota archaeon]